jgi:hypothetical protein
MGQQNSMKPTILSCLIILIAMLSPNQQSLGAQIHSVSSHPKVPCLVPEDELQVIAAYLKHGDSATTLTVVVTETEPSGADIDYLNLQLAARGHGIPADVRSDFKDKDKSSCGLSISAGIGNVEFISKAQEKALFRDGWKAFHTKYGKDASLLKLSRVGFSSSKELALVHVSSGVGPMAAGGRLYILERNGGQWAIKESIETWTT